MPPRPGSPPQERPALAAEPLIARWSVSRVSELADLRARVATAARSAVPEQSERAAEGLLVLVVSELATNGLKYGTPPLVVSLHRTGQGWLVDVRDGNGDRAPEVRPPARERTGGHGLRIIDHASTAWGWYRDHDHPRAPGKHVWAHVPAASAS